MDFRSRYFCPSCAGHFDAGELVGGICMDCRSASEENESKMEWTRKMFRDNFLEQKDGQMVIGLCK